MRLISNAKEGECLEQIILLEGDEIPVLHNEDNRALVAIFLPCVIIDCVQYLILEYGVLLVPHINRHIILQTRNTLISHPGMLTVKSNQE